MHDHQHRGAGKPVQSRPGTLGLQPKPSRKGMESSPEESAGVGTSAGVSSGQHVAAALADFISERPQFFNFDAQAVRVIGDSQKPLFVAKDVCAVLGLRNPSLAINGNATRGETGLDPDEKAVCNVNTLGGVQEMLCVTESGLYGLIFKSRRKEARVFRRWVTNEVIPAIRKSGSYAIGGSVQVREYAVVKLPPAPRTDAVVGVVLAHVLQHDCSTFATPRDLARAAVAAGEFASLCSSANDRRQVAALREFLAGYHGKWVPGDFAQDCWYCLVPVGRKPYRRYFLRVRRQESMPQEREAAPWSGRWEPRDALPPSRRVKEVAS